MHIAIFGGAFDPPHQAHLRIAASLLQHGLVDQVWFLPVKSHAFNKKLSDFSVRVAMVQLLIAGQKNMRIEEYELQQQGPNYTDETLAYLSKQYPQHTFSFVIGSDNLESFHKWHNYKALLRTHHLFVYPRAGFLMHPLLENMEAVTSLPPIAISSTQVRTAVSHQQPISDLVTPEVAAYISDHQLYRNTESTYVTTD